MKQQPIGRRGLLKTVGLGAIGFAAGTAFTAPSCDKKSIAVEVSTAIAFLNKVSSLLPGKTQFIAKIVGVLNDFNTAYQAGKFASAMTFFENADSLFTQLINDLGVSISPAIKIALAIVDAAVSAIAVLLKDQTGAPGVSDALAAATPEQQKQAALVEKRAAHAENLFAAIKQ